MNVKLKKKKKEYVSNKLGAGKLIIKVAGCRMFDSGSSRYDIRVTETFCTKSDGAKHLTLLGCNTM